MKSLLMTPDNHKAIRDKLKTQTRRVIRYVNDHNINWQLEEEYANLAKQMRDNTARFMNMHPKVKEPYTCLVKAHYQVGDIVYIKEAWAIPDLFDRMNAKEVENTGIATTSIWYRYNDHQLDNPDSKPRGRWRSPLFMPEWVARTFIKITSVEPQKLQDIPWYDIPKEGIQDDTWSIGQNRFVKKTPKRLISDFKHLWDSINKKYPWESKPWVWKYEFELVGKQ